MGAISAGVLLSNKITEANRKEEKEREDDWRRLVRHIDQLALNAAPISELANIKYYMRRIRNETREAAGVKPNVTTNTVEEAEKIFSHDEIADEWVRRRNNGNESALKIERSRLKLKRFWHTVENTVDFHHDSTTESGSSQDESAILSDLLGGGRGKKEPNDRLILKTIFFLEMLDKACCRNHPKCVWERDAPSFYSLLRRNARRDEAWPGPYSNDDDFDPDAPPINSSKYNGMYNRVPDSRLALVMSKRKSEL